MDVEFEQCLRVVALQDLDDLYKNTPVHILETEPAEVKHNNNSGQWSRTCHEGMTSAHGSSHSK